MLSWTCCDCYHVWYLLSSLLLFLLVSKYLFTFQHCIKLVLILKLFFLSLTLSYSSCVSKEQEWFFSTNNDLVWVTCETNCWFPSPCRFFFFFLLTLHRKKCPKAACEPLSVIKSGQLQVTSNQRKQLMQHFPGSTSTPTKHQAECDMSLKSWKQYMTCKSKHCWQWPTSVWSQELSPAAPSNCTRATTGDALCLPSATKCDPRLFPETGAHRA